MDKESISHLHRVTLLVTFNSIVFTLFFQIDKMAPFRDINPFGEDPYDAVGSFAIQGALFIGILTYARALRLFESQGQAKKVRLIIRGNAFVLSLIQITLITDATAAVVRPIPSSYWGRIMRVELILMFVLTLICITWLAIVYRRLQPEALSGNLTIADGIDDLWTLVRFPATKASAYLPNSLVERIQCFSSDRLFARIQWLNPRTHYWRFACTLGLLIGIALALAQLQEGLPPNFKIGLLVTGIFLSAELSATLLGFAIFGGYLGLRPPFIKNSAE